MTRPEPAPRASRSDWALLALLALSLSFNVLVVFRLTTGVTHLPQARASSREGPPVLVAGSLMPAVTVQRLDGRPETITWQEGARPTLLYVFAPSCRWCARNEQNLRALVARIKDTHRVIGLSLDPDADAVKAYARAHEMNFPIYVEPAAETVAAYGLGATPQTLLLDSSGTLVHSWVGAYAGTVGQDIERVFGIAFRDAVR